MKFKYAKYNLCGRGEFLYLASKSGWKAVGTDVSEAFVDYANRQGEAKPD